jgi:ribonuclease J
LLVDPRVTLQGAAEPDAEQLAELSADIARAVEALSPRERKDDAAVGEAARAVVRRRLKAWQGKRPVTDVHVVRV